MSIIHLSMHIWVAFSNLQFYLEIKSEWPLFVIFKFRGTPLAPNQWQSCLFFFHAYKLHPMHFFNYAKAFRIIFTMRFLLACKIWKGFTLNPLEKWEVSEDRMIDWWILWNAEFQILWSLMHWLVALALLKDLHLSQWGSVQVLHQLNYVA